MTWLYIVGYLLIGIIFTFVVVKYSISLIWEENDALGVGLMVIIWPIAVAIVLASALGALIIRAAGRKRK